MTESSNPLELIAVAAMCSNRVIGKSGKLPWHIPEDLAFFKQLTSGYPVIMGRKTFESIGRALPNRRNVIISKSLETAPEGTSLFNSIDELSRPEACLYGKVFVIGGAQVYASLMQKIGEIYLSYIYEEHEGDTFFPEFEEAFEPFVVIKKYESFEVRHHMRRPGA
jgi:dihydrofolate reductase